MNKLILIYSLALLSALLSAGCAKKSTTTNASTLSDHDGVYLQVVNLTQGSTFSVSYTATPKSASTQKMTQQLTQNKTSPFSVSDWSEFANGNISTTLLDPNGVEVKFDRDALNSIGTSLTVPATGEYRILIRNNSEEELDLSQSTISGATDEGELVPIDETTQTHSDIFVKAIVNFSRSCKKNSGGTNVNQPTTTSYFVQPFVFIGKIGDNKTITELQNATITLGSGGKTITLSKLSDLPFDSYNELSGLTEAQHQIYTKKFYQGYFGAAGEMYTTNDFFGDGDCDTSADVFELGADPGLTNITLSIVDNTVSPAINESIKIKATLEPSFNTYENNDTPLTNYTQCTIDKSTGEPKTYNGDAGVCKNFSLTDLPYIKMDQAASAIHANEGATLLSDPTRILVYGHSFQKAFWKEIITHSTSILANNSPTLTVSGCLNNGGLIGVPLNTAKTYLPLGELNVNIEDVISLAYRSGSYTGLTEYYQGKIDLSGSVQIPACISNGTDSCAEYKVVDVKVNECLISGESGVAVGSIGSSFMYPSYFRMSGVITQSAD